MSADFDFRTDLPFVDVALDRRGRYSVRVYACAELALVELSVAARPSHPSVPNVLRLTPEQALALGRGLVRAAEEAGR